MCFSPYCSLEIPVWHLSSTHDPSEEEIFWTFSCYFISLPSSHVCRVKWQEEEVSAELGSDSQGGTWACEVLALLGITLTSDGILKRMGKAARKGKTLFLAKGHCHHVCPSPSDCVWSYSKSAINLPSWLIFEPHPTPQDKTQGDNGGRHRMKPVMLVVQTSCRS